MLAKKHLIFLGLTTGIHDTSASIIIDGNVIAASLEERFDRRKHSGNFPVNAIRFCLNKAQISDINEVSEVCIGWDWMLRGKYRFLMRFNKNDSKLTRQAVQQMLEDIERAEKVELFMRNELGYKGKIGFYDHHNCHASLCYFLSPFQSAAIVIIDGAGEKASTRIYQATDNKLKKMLQINYPHSIGRFYGWMTDYLGFQIEADEGKVMGLAAYGNDSFVNDMRKVLILNKNGSFRLEMKYFEFHRNNQVGVSRKFIKTFGPKRNSGEEILETHKNIARAVQIVTEDAFISLTTLAKNITQEENLCLCGGAILNSVANGKIVESGLFKNIYIYAAPGDDGTGLGAALYSYNSKLFSKEFIKENQNPYLGYEASEAEIINAITKYSLNIYKSKNVEKEIAQFLSERQVIGHYYKRAEFGPRALGNRSILADPRFADNKDIVNNKIKFRENFRPFGPTVLKEFADQYFEMLGNESVYMNFALKVKENKRELIPAVIHIDGTARVQTVSKEENNRFWNIINEFYKITGIPIVLNTSFNKAGEVIVNTPEHAVESFLSSGLDVLVLNDYIIKK